MLTVGILSWNSPDKLDRAISQVLQNTIGEYKLLIVDNASTDIGTKGVIQDYVDKHDHVSVKWNEENRGYAGGVNQILRYGKDEHYVAYVENDAYIMTPGWNERFINIMETHHEVNMVFPGTYISYPIQRSGYTEIMWGVGCCWMLNTARLTDVGYLDEKIGHQNECDYALRMRLAGWKLAADRAVEVQHDANSTRNPEAQERINNGIIEFVDKWNEYFCGRGQNYFSTNVLRWEDWHPNALYLEEYNKQFLPPDFNQNIEQMVVAGNNYDVVKVLRYPYLYRDRIV